MRDGWSEMKPNDVQRGLEGISDWCCCGSIGWAYTFILLLIRYVTKYVKTSSMMLGLSLGLCLPKGICFVICLSLFLLCSLPSHVSSQHSFSSFCSTLNSAILHPVKSFYHCLCISDVAERISSCSLLLILELIISILSFSSAKWCSKLIILSIMEHFRPIAAIQIWNGCIV